MDPTDSKPADPAGGVSRRAVIGGAEIAAAAAAAPVFAQAQDAAAPAAAVAPTQSVMRDPLTQYPKPPFPLQTQEWPGLASLMDPRPDHGEESYVGTGRLLGRRALITGGDSGLGRATAIAYAREGADVAINYLPQEETDAAEVVALIEAAGRRAVAIPGDIRDEAFCQALVADAVEALGGLDILVSNAALQQAQPSIEDITTEQFDSTMKTNLYAMFWITKAALPHMPAGSTIIVTSSEQAVDPSANLLDYAQTKAAQVAFTRSMAKQLAPKGIRVNAVAPGPFWTPLQPSGGAEPQDIPAFGGQTPLGRPGQPAELAATYVLLASQESSYASGQVYGSQGGSGKT